MTVSVAQKPVYSPGALSDLMRLVLGMVDGGQPWLTWAIYDPVARYRFDDEAALIAAVQNGLHASPFALLPRLGLMVSPVKLMTLRPAELRTLAQAEASDPKQPIPEDVARILKLHGLATSDALDQGAQWLRGAGVPDRTPLFQAPAVNDRIALAALASGRGGEASYANSPFAKEAAAFALAEARTPLEFVDYYRIYVDMSRTPAEGPAAPAANAPDANASAANAQAANTPAEREARARQAVTTLLPLLFGALDCPRVEGLVAPAEVAAAIDDWQMMGRRLGFSRITLGVQQVVAYSSFRRLPIDQAGRSVDAYIAGAQALLRKEVLGAPRLAQDGASCSFRLRSESEVADVAQDASGIISLGSYRARRSDVEPLDDDGPEEGSDEGRDDETPGQPEAAVPNNKSR